MFRFLKKFIFILPLFLISYFCGACVSAMSPYNKNKKVYKVAVVGNLGVGKTSLLSGIIDKRINPGNDRLDRTFTKGYNNFHEKTFTICTPCYGYKDIKVNFIDTAGRTVYDGDVYVGYINSWAKCWPPELENLMQAIKNSDIVLVCFSLIGTENAQEIEKAKKTNNNNRNLSEDDLLRVRLSNWVEIVQNNAPDSHIMLVATKFDEYFLRNVFVHNNSIESAFNHLCKKYGKILNELYTENKFNLDFFITSYYENFNVDTVRNKIISILMEKDEID